MKKVPAWVVLTAICLVAAVLLAGTNLLTKDTIAANVEKEKNAALQKLIPEGVVFDRNDEIGLYTVSDVNGNVVGYIAAGIAQGFGGEVETMVATDTEGTILGVSVGGASFAESPGYGALAKEEGFQSQFAGMSGTLSLKSDGGEVEAISGATRTSRAVIKGANEAMGIIGENAGFEIAPAPAADTAALKKLPTPVTVGIENGDKVSAAAQGFAGSVRVFATVDSEDRITSIRIGDSAFKETAGLGQLAQDDTSFLKQFIGKTLPLDQEAIDGIAGATYTTNAVLNAFSQIGRFVEYKKTLPVEEVTAEVSVEVVEDVTASEPDAVTEATSGATAKNEDMSVAETPESEASSVSSENNIATLTVGEEIGKRYSAAVQGFNGPVRVFVSVDDENRITSIRIGDSKFAETDGLGGKAREEAFLSRFVGKQLPLNKEEIDGITGATITTNAVFTAIDMISRLLENSTIPAENEPVTEITSETDAMIPGRNITAAAKGFNGNVRVFVTLDDQNAITAITVGGNGFAETEGLGQKAQEAEFLDQFIGKALPLNASDIDGISGATITTGAVLDAINQIANFIVE